MKKGVNKEIMEGLLNTDFYYEITSLRECLGYMKKHTNGHNVPDVILTGFLVHLRNLYEFFMVIL